MEYSNHLAPDEPAFWRLCQGDDCHCDYRLTLSNCLDSNALRIIIIVDIVWSVINAITLYIYTFHRVYIRNQTLFDFTGKIPRPRPIESMCLFGAIFNTGRIINATVLISDVAKNGIVRSFLFELPWIFGVISLSSYFFGVFHTLANSSKVIYSGWIGSQFTLDIFCLILLSSPLFTTIPSSIISGYYAQIGNSYLAGIWTSINYYIWVAHDILIGTSILLAGLRLLKLLKQHLKTQGNNEENRAKIKLGATKVKIIIFIGCNCLWGYGIFMCYYAASRFQVMQSFTATVVMTCLTLFIGPLTSSTIICALLLNVRILNGFNNLSIESSGNEGNTNVDKTSNRFSSHVMDSKGDDNIYSVLKFVPWGKSLTTSQDQSSSVQYPKNESFDYKSIEEYELIIQQNQFHEEGKDVDEEIKIEYHQSSNNNNNINNNNHHHQQNTNTSIIETNHQHQYHNNNNNNNNNNGINHLEQQQYQSNGIKNQIKSSYHYPNQLSTIIEDNDSNASSSVITHGNIPRF